MSTDATETHSAAPASHSSEHAHPSPTVYIQIAVVLAVITGVEVLIYYQPSLKPVLVPILLVLSAVKFATVVAFYMHLRFDNRLFTMVFSGPLVLAFAVMVALLSLFHRVLLGV